MIADQKSMLARMFENSDESAILPAASKDENGAYFIDRDPRVNYISYHSFFGDNAFDFFPSKV